MGLTRNQNRFMPERDETLAGAATFGGFGIVFAGKHCLKS
jgi:hypothetical protein